MNKVAVLGSGEVGRILANGMAGIGYDVTLASRDGRSIEGWSGKTARFKSAAREADIVVLSVKGTVAEDLVQAICNELAGKTIIDTTNPIAELPPENGVIRYFTNLNESLMERLQKIAPKAHFVKAFNSVGNQLMVNPKLEQKSTMFMCGNSKEAKKIVSGIVEKFGWEAKDIGGVESARAIEPLCMLWCIPGFLDNDWNHAFKYVS